ncbi:sigma-70 family RNA polymerase sigma factor [Paenibacillus campinasensis]|uniref:Uncharacterized protein n=1 Tax=Paenibacillus campinasensis TaxID=66347 RepID=A0A268EGY4_9BACL|nr:sigma-70 family RNA polymerase sigma factor [Paenibacillus campinasensis]PAD72407.1 hypothetical protein CHH67_22465 [Paenibacillus campinasensis]
MGTEKLNKAFQAYRLNPDGDSFNDLYTLARETFLAPNRGKLAVMGHRDVNDADAIFDDVFLRISGDVDIRDFAHTMRTSLRNARIDLIRSESSRRKWIDRYLDDDSDKDESAPTLQLRSEENVECEAIFSEKKKRTNQRQLIDSLLESAKILLDPTMIAVIERIKRGETPNAIAKSLGLQRNTVDRKLRRLARGYDRNIHGDITDYMPDSVRIRREFLTA